MKNSTSTPETVKTVVTSTPKVEKKSKAKTPKAAMNAKVVKVAKAPKDEKVVKVKTGKSIPVSKFKRAQPSDDSAIVDFLNKANYKMEGKAILDAWINPKDEKKEELVVVVITQDNPDAINDVLYKTDKGIEVVECESMFETFQVHKEARFLN